jgi:glycosyltransferase involved in cell wall biosynthesis
MKRLKKNLQDILNDLNIFRLLAKKHYDFILIRDKFLPTIYSIIASKFNRAKFIFWLSFPFPEVDFYKIENRTARYPFIYLLRGHFRKFVLYKIIFRYADHIFVQTSYMKEFIHKEYGMAKKKMTPVPMGVDFDRVPYFGHKISSDNSGEKKSIIYLGTLVKTRKLDFLIRVFNIVKKRIPNSVLYLVGGGVDESDEDFLLSEIEKFDLNESVVITGMLPQLEAWQYVKKAHVCVSPIFPSLILNCGSPTKLIEYMAMGKAVVVNDHPEQREIIQKSLAGICVPWDENEFADAIIKLLNDPESCRRKGVLGYEYVLKYRSYDSLADIVDNKLLSIVESP